MAQIVTFSVSAADTITAGSTISVPSEIGALGSVLRGNVGTGLALTGTVGNVTAAATGAISLNGSRNYLFAGDIIPGGTTLEVEAIGIGEETTRSAAFSGLPGVS